MSKWYIGAGEQSDIVVSTRIRLARNIGDYPFPSKLNTKSKTELNNMIKEAVENDNKFGLRYIEMKTLARFEAASMAERHIISPEFASDADGRALMLSPEEDICIMLNEEDHIRVQVMKSGFALDEAYSIADSIDDLLNTKFNFAFDSRIGYLTQCPTNLGTGMRASVMLHLPALTMGGQINRLISTVSKLGLTIRGAFGEGTLAVGDMYQLSNQITLGISEEFAIKNLKAITLQLCAQERAAREELLNDPTAEDRIFRAYGLLKWARLLSTKELMENLSLVRMGAVSGKISVPIETINELMISMQPASINVMVGKRLEERDRDAIRAKTVREKL
ncbi:MAG: protein arginine kinase [Oscillospiraceae bacterium]|nr:protein arginine kinase [Oscillospiraceae bacterium]